MARRGGTRNRMELREQYEAAERRKSEDEEVEDEADEEEEEDDEEEEEAVEADEGEDEAEDEEEAPVVKKKRKPAKEPKPKRTRAVKIVRQRVVWVVFDNSNRKVATYEYPRKQEAEEHALRLQTEKKQTYFIQPVKEPIEDKKD